MSVVRFRVCAVCGKRHGATFGFKTILARNGIKGDKAAISCIRKLPSLPFQNVVRKQ